MPRKSDIRLGQFLIQRQWCTLQEVTEALENQRALRTRSANKHLGRILVEQGDLAEARLVEALAQMGVLEMRCTRCDWRGPIVAAPEGQAGACTGCGGVLELPEDDERSAAAGGDRTGDGSRVIVVDEVTSAVELTEHPSRSGPRAPARGIDDAADDRSGRRGPRDRGVTVSSLDPAPVAAETTDPQVDTDDPFVGRTLGGCLLNEKIARGGMGLIYKACQVALNRVVAVKILSEDLSRDRSFVERFLEEARSAAQLNHHNIVHINDVGDAGGVYYFIMEFVDGENLKSILKRKKVLSIERSLAITLQVCNALRHAHAKRIIHRDIKPENIMITNDGVVKLADLGLAKRIESANDGLTKAGSIFGTPYYMAPEQAKNFSDVDQRSDIYSLGVTLFKMISGRVPFEGRSPIEIMVKAFDGKRPTLSSLRKDVLPRAEQLVDRMMARLPQDRYQCVDAVIEDLKEVLGVLSNRSRVEKLLSVT